LASYLDKMPAGLYNAAIKKNNHKFMIDFNELMTSEVNYEEEVAKKKCDCGEEGCEECAGGEEGCGCGHEHAEEAE